MQSRRPYRYRSPSRSTDCRRCCARTRTARAARPLGIVEESCSFSKVTDGRRHETDDHPHCGLIASLLIPRKVWLRCRRGRGPGARRSGRSALGRVILRAHREHAVAIRILPARIALDTDADHHRLVQEHAGLLRRPGDAARGVDVSQQALADLDRLLTGVVEGDVLINLAMQIVTFKDLEHREHVIAVAICGVTNPGLDDVCEIPSCRDGLQVFCALMCARIEHLGQLIVITHCYSPYVWMPSFSDVIVSITDSGAAARTLPACGCGVGKNLPSVDG